MPRTATTAPALRDAQVFLPFAGVRKSTAKTADGIEVTSRIVTGVMTDETVDLDGEIVDYDAAKKAAEAWFRDWANIREQHGRTAIGTGIEMVADDERREIRLSAEIVDPLAIVKIDKGVYKGQSVGLKNCRTIKDAKAPNGRLVPELMIENSIVDRPANPSAKIAILKRAKDGSVEEGEAITYKLATTDDGKLAELAESEDGKAADEPEQALEQPEEPAAPAAEPEKDVVADVAKAAVPELESDEAQHNEPLRAAVSAIQTLIQQESTEASPDFGDVAWLARIGADLTMWAADEAWESDSSGVYLAVLPEFQKLAEAGERRAAIKFLRGAFDAIERTKAAFRPAPVPAPPAPAEAPEAPTKAAQIDEPEPAADDQAKQVLPEVMKAAISESVTKAIGLAVGALKGEVESMKGSIQKLESRAAPGGPLLRGSRLLEAPEEVRAASLASRLEDAQMLLEHEDPNVRAAAKQVIAAFGK